MQLCTLAVSLPPTVTAMVDPRGQPSRRCQMVVCGRNTAYAYHVRTVYMNLCCASLRSTFLRDCVSEDVSFLGAHAQRGLLSVCRRFNSLLGDLFIPQTIPSTQRVKSISLIEEFLSKRLRYRDIASTASVRLTTGGHFLCA